MPKYPCRHAITYPQEIMASNLTSPHLAVSPPQTIVDAYKHMVLVRLAQGWEAYLLTFMFNQLPGPRSAVAREMDAAVEHIYGKMSTRVVRNPRSGNAHCGLPLWLIAPDFPVPKKATRDALVDVAPNNGEHRQGIGLMPPNSRMKETLVEHVETHQALYAGAGRAVARFRADAITRDPEYVCDYAMKSVLRKRVGQDEIIVLPPSTSEITLLSRAHRLS